MALADFFVQPGAGRLTILDSPRYLQVSRLAARLSYHGQILGGILRHGEDARIPGQGRRRKHRRRNSFPEDSGLRERLAAGAVDVSAKYFNWRRSARTCSLFIIHCAPTPKS